MLKSKILAHLFTIFNVYCKSQTMVYRLQILSGIKELKEILTQTSWMVDWKELNNIYSYNYQIILYELIIVKKINFLFRISFAFKLFGETQHRNAELLLGIIVQVLHYILWLNARRWAKMSKAEVFINLRHESQVRQLNVVSLNLELPGTQKRIALIKV